MNVVSRPKVILYALAWHLKTSDAVLEALVRPLAPWLDIELEAWDGVVPPRLPGVGESVVFFQLPPPLFDPDWRRVSLTWVPMWDHTAAQRHSRAWWAALPACWRILAFTEVVADLARGREGVMRRVYHRRAKAEAAWGQEERVLYYWNRVGLAGPVFLEKLCGCLKVDRLLFRSELDPGIPATRGYELPDRLGQTVVERVPFYEDKSAYEAQVGRAMFLLAPRPLEGIGMVMLDAMAKGAVVLAAPYPAAEDYLRHGENGVLFSRSEVETRLRPTLPHGAWWTEGNDFLLSEAQDWEGLSRLSFEQMGRQAAVDAQEISDVWENGLPELAAFIGGDADVETSPEVIPAGGMEPLVSICVPHLNSTPFTGERIESIRSQSWQNWECVVVDSGSTDGSLALWEEAAAADPRIRVEPRLREGIYPAFNEAVRLAGGEFVYIATADDTLHPRGLEAMVRGLLAHPECGVCHTPVSVIDSDGVPLKSLAYWNAGWNVLGDWAYVPHVRAAPFDALCFGLYGSLYLSVTQLLYRREVLRKAGEFPDRFGSLGDFWFHLRTGSLTDVLYLPEVYGTWRWHSGQASSQTGDAEHSRRLAAMVRDVWPEVVSLHPALRDALSGGEAGLVYRLQAFSAALRAQPAYVRRGLALLEAMVSDPGILRHLHLGSWNRDLSFRLEPLPIARKFFEKAGAMNLISGG